MGRGWSTEEKTLENPYLSQGRNVTNNTDKPLWLAFVDARLTLYSQTYCLALVFFPKPHYG